MSPSKYSATKSQRPQKTTHTLLNSRKVLEVTSRSSSNTSTPSERNALKRPPLKNRIMPMVLVLTMRTRMVVTMKKRKNEG